MGKKRPSAWRCLSVFCMSQLLKIGLKPGRIFKEILNAVQEAWYENPNLSKDDAMIIVNKIKTDSQINEIKKSILFW